MAHPTMRSRRRPAARPPINTDLEIKERMAVKVFSLGVARPMHYQLLIDMTNMLMLAGSSDDARRYASEFVESKALPVLASIKARFERTERLGVTALEMKALYELIDFNYQFWARQPIELFHYAGEELKAYYAELAERRRVRQ